MDSETRRTMKQFIKECKTNTDPLELRIESFTDWVYDLAYRKGWHDGYWRQEADLNYQIAFVRKRTECLKEEI